MEKTIHIGLDGFIGVKNISIDKQLLNIRMFQTVQTSSREHNRTNIIPITFYIACNDKEKKS